MPVKRTATKYSKPTKANAACGSGSKPKAPKSAADRPCKCDFPDCNKSFTRGRDLPRHKKLHAPDNLKEELKTQCDWINPETGKQCGHSTLQLSNLRTHKATHYKIPCSHEGCEQRFDRTKALDEHLENIHKSVPHRTNSNTALQPVQAVSTTGTTRTRRSGRLNKRKGDGASAPSVVEVVHTAIRRANDTSGLNLLADIAIDVEWMGLTPSYGNPSAKLVSCASPAKDARFRPY